jgi:hypothetical protein
MSTAGLCSSTLVAPGMPFADNSPVMSISTIQTDNIWQDAQLSVDPVALRQLQTQMTPRRFRGRLDIPGLPFIPEFDFVASIVGDRFAIESLPSNAWPTILIEHSIDALLGEPRPKYKHFALRLANDTTDAWLKHTRVSLSLDKAGKLSIQAEDSGEVLEMKFDLLSDPAVLQLARLSRKLKFIEGVFNTRFAVPDIVSSDDMSTAEIVFRGITEGEFRIRGEQYIFSKVSPTDIDLTKPPFDGAGEFTYDIGRTVKLLGRELDVGPVTVHLDRAELASPRVVDHIRKGSAEPVAVRFEVLDNQITYRFEDYVTQSVKDRRQELRRFKGALACEEPEEIVGLIDESLQGDVSSEEALRIAVGWQQYYNLPDRYCSQEPALDDAAAQWRVPIYLVYSNGEGGPVGEVVIDEKTGIIVNHTPIDELRSKGLALAEQILHA